MDIEKIYNEYFKIVYRYVLSLSRDPELSEDIAQETFLRALRSAERLGDDANVKAWLCAIARNAYYRHYDRERRRDEITPRSDEEYDDSPESRMLAADSRVRLHRLLHELEEPYKEVFSLRTFGELSFKEIGEIFGKSDSWARVTYHRARKKLREAITDEDKL